VENEYFAVQSLHVSSWDAIIRALELDSFQVLQEFPTEQLPATSITNINSHAKNDIKHGNLEIKIFTCPVYYVALSLIDGAIF